MTGSFNPHFEEICASQSGNFLPTAFYFGKWGPKHCLKPPPRTSQEMILIWPNFEHLLNLRPVLITGKKWPFAT